jgi:hypothetical protein
MAERDRFEFDLAAALRAYLEDAPTEVRPTELARQFATAYPHRRTALGRWDFGLTPAMAWVLLLVGLLLALVMGGLVAGAWQADHAVAIAPSAMFSPTGSMKTARVHHTATLLADGRVLIAGGNGAQAPLASAEIYEPKTGTFGPTGSMTTARAGHTAALLANGRVLITGGHDPDLSNATGSLVVFASAELYDPATGTFGPTGSMTTARVAHTATLLADGRVLIAGGDGALASALASAEIYDPKTGTFSPTGSMTTARVGTATLLPDGRVLIAGGESLASAEIYDPNTGGFGPTGSMATARERHTATLLADGRVLVAGGIRSFDGGLNASAELYDPTTGSFGPSSSMTTIREWHTATLLADGRVLVTGGDGVQAPLASADIFVP